MLTGVLNDSSAQASATETLGKQLTEAALKSTLVLCHNDTATYRDDEHYRTILTRLATATIDRDSEAGADPDPYATRTTSACTQPPREHPPLIAAPWISPTTLAR